MLIFAETASTIRRSSREKRLFAKSRADDDFDRPNASTGLKESDGRRTVLSDWRSFQSLLLCQQRRPELNRPGTPIGFSGRPAAALHCLARYQSNERTCLLTTDKGTADRVCRTNSEKITARCPINCSIAHPRSES